MAEKKKTPKSRLEYFGIKVEVQEMKRLQQRVEGLQQHIKEKRDGIRYETTVDKVYYDYREPGDRAGEKPAELQSISYDGKYGLLIKLLHHESKPEYVAKGEVRWSRRRKSPVLSLPGGDLLSRRPSLSPPVIAFLEDIITYHHYVWSVVGNKFRLEDYGSSTHFDLAWPKGDGYRYDIFPAAGFPDLPQDVDTIRHLGNWAYGSLDTAYKTKSGLVVLKFSFRAD